MSPPDSPALSIEVHGLRKAYRAWYRRESIPALRGIDLSVRQGEVFGFLGPNGAGKTTTVKLLLGLLRPDAGTIRVLGREAGDLKAKRFIGYMPERSLLPDYMRLDEMLHIFGSLGGLRGAALRQAIDRVLGIVDLQRVRRQRLDTFSKGMQQRASLAQALLCEPQLLILDEPAIGLDPLARRDLRQLIRQLGDRGVTVFLNSHELEVVEQVCDRFAILGQGRVLAVEPISALRDTQRHVIELANPPPQPDALCQSLPFHATWQTQSPALHVQCPDVEGLNRTLDELRRQGYLVQSVNPQTLTLEELFMSHVASARTPQEA